MQSKDDAWQGVVTTDLLPNDVLLGRGTGPNEHAGNCLFRDEVESHKEAYISAPNKATEEEIVTDIISSIHQKRGRFLRKIEPQKDLKFPGKPVYEVVVERKVLAYKIKQAIRYSKRRDKKLEASQEVNKIKASAGSAQVDGNSEGAKSGSRTSSHLAPSGNLFGLNPNDLLSSESERLLLMAQNASTLPAGFAQSQFAASQRAQELIQRVRAQGQLSYPNTVYNLMPNPEPATNTLSPDVLDELAILHLQRTDPMAYQLVIDRRRQQQEVSQMESLTSWQHQQLGRDQHQLLRETNALLREPTVHTPSQSATVSDTIWNMARLNRRGSIDTSFTSQSSANSGVAAKSSEEPASKRHKKNWLIQFCLYMNPILDFAWQHTMVHLEREEFHGMTLILMIAVCHYDVIILTLLFDRTFVSYFVGYYRNNRTYITMHHCVSLFGLVYQRRLLFRSSVTDDRKRQVRSASKPIPYTNTYALYPLFACPRRLFYSSSIVR